MTLLINKSAGNKTPLKALAGSGVGRVGRGGSHGPGRVLGLEATFELCLVGVRLLWDGATVPSQRAPALRPRRWRPASRGGSPAASWAHLPLR